MGTQQQPPLRPDHIRDVTEDATPEPESGNSALQELKNAIFTRLTQFELRVAERFDSVDERLNDLGGRVTRVEDPLMRKVVSGGVRYGTVVAVAGAVAQFAAARWPEVGGVLKAVGEALSGALGGG